MSVWLNILTIKTDYELHNIKSYIAMIYDLATKKYSLLFENLKKAISQGMIVKNYCTTVEKQPLFDFSTVEALHILKLL